MRSERRSLLRGRRACAHGGTGLARENDPMNNKSWYFIERFSVRRGEVHLTTFNGRARGPWRGNSIKIHRGWVSAAFSSLPYTTGLGRQNDERLYRPTYRKHVLPMVCRHDDSIDTHVAGSKSCRTDAIIKKKIRKRFNLFFIFDQIVYTRYNVRVVFGKRIFFRNDVYHPYSFESSQSSRNASPPSFKASFNVKNKK